MKNIVSFITLFYLLSNLYSCGIRSKLNNFDSNWFKGNENVLLAIKKKEYEKALNLSYGLKKYLNTKNLNNSAEMATTLNNIGMIYFALLNYEKSNYYLNNALAIRILLFGDKSTETQLVKQNINYLYKEAPYLTTPSSEELEIYFSKNDNLVVNSSIKEQNNNTQEKALPGPAPDAEKDVSGRFAVVVGISQYRDPRIPKLRYAASDATALYDWLTSPEGGRYAPSRVKLLTDQQATTKNIKNALFVWLKQALKEDMVTIYFAGHGSSASPDDTENLFLLPYDTAYDDVASTGFPMWDVETALKRFIAAERVVVIADACHSGGVGNSFDIARRANRSIKVNPIGNGLHQLTNVAPGVCVITASDDKQYSQEGAEWGGGHGLFTYFLLQGLKGDADFNADAAVTLGELTSYVSQNVRRASKNTQSPTIAGRYDPAMCIGHR